FSRVLTEIEMVPKNEAVEEPLADSPTSVLEDEGLGFNGFRDVCKEKVAVKVDEETFLEAKNGDSLLISDAMAEEEKKLELQRQLEEENVEKEAPALSDTQFTKLDELLTQTQLYSEFLLEKMDDITNNGLAEDVAEVKEEKKKGRGKKRKVTTEYNTRRAKTAVAAMLNRAEENTASKDTNLSKEEKAEKEQNELVPLLTGGKLKPYQIKGVKWLISLWQNGLNGILADQMGLGKTIQTIGFLAHLKGKGLDGPYLVIAPLSTLSNWLNEITRFVPSVNAVIYHGDKKEREEIRRKKMPKKVEASFPIVITSYEVAMNDAKKHLRHYNWKYLVVDEGHRLKNSKCKLLRELKWLNVVAKLHAILRPFLLRRMKEDVELSLPRKKEIILYANLTEHQRNFQDHLVNKTLETYLREKLDTGRGVKGTLQNVFLQLRKNCNHPDLLEAAFEGFYPPVEQIVGQCGKFQLLERLLQKLLPRKHKVLVFSQWTKILDILHYYFSEKGMPVCRIDGGVRLEDRRQQNPQMDLQAMDRCHRIGQTKPVHVYRLATALSIEGRMLKRAFSKLRLEHVVIGKGQFQQERTKTNNEVLETDISDEDLDKVLDRSDLIASGPAKADGKLNFVTSTVPLKGPGWEVVIPTATGGMLSTVNN
ncbi:hypothetical protein M8C21_018130, partial [Ambrosia artemisiifolia]